MESCRYLRCLGQPAFFAESGEVIRFRTKKHFALLLFLAVDSRRTHRRDRLADFLWPKSGAAEARHSVATALSILRPRVGIGALETSRDHVRLNLAHISVDVDRLLAGNVVGPGLTQSLEIAAFLDGFDIPDAPEFSLWKDRQQARLLPAIKDALVVLIDRCRRTGDTRQIEYFADRMMALDDLSEEAIRAKMEARAFAGDRLTALQIFEEWKTRLSDELGAMPSELVEGIAVRLRRRGWERTTRIEIPTVPTDQWKNRHFVGRTNEYRLLYEAWESTRSGSASSVLVLGDSGVGKTTLVEKLTTAAGLEGCVLSRVQCYDLERDIPYCTLVSLVSGLVDGPGASATQPESLAELARTVPDVRRRFPSIPPAVESHGETSRIRLTEAFYELLRAITEEQPVILVLDDVHMADDASLAVLHLIMRRAKALPILVVLIARPGELENSPQATRLRNSTHSLNMRQIDVAPLSDEESTALLTALTSLDCDQPPASARQSLLKSAAGFPMVLELLYQDYKVHGDQSLALAVDAMTSHWSGSSVPPHIYREALERLVRTLDPCTHSVLNLAAVLGRRLNDMTLYSIADLGVGQVMAGLTDLVSRRVLRDGGNGLEFVNELLRTAAYLGVPSPLRGLLHSNIADRLIAKAGASQGASDLEIAWHCMRAGRGEEATPHLLKGARDAIRSGAPHSAERALITALPELCGEPLEDASLLLAEVLHEQGRSTEALEILRTLAPTSSSLHSDRAIALTALIKLTLGPTTTTGIHNELPQLEKIVRCSTAAGTRALAGRAMAYITGETRDHQLTSTLLLLLDTIPFADLDTDAVGELSLARALLLFNTGNSRQAFTQALAGIEELRKRAAANLVMLQLLGGLGSILLREGQYDTALEYFEQSLAMAKRLGNDRQISLAVGNIALCYGRLGRYSDQLEWASRAPVGPAVEFVGFLEIQLAYSKAFACAMLGWPDLALREVNTLDERLIGSLPAWMLQAWAFWKADIQFLCGQTDTAFSTALEALTVSKYALFSPAFAGPYARWLCRSSKRSGDPGVATSRLQEMAQHIDRYDALDQVEVLQSLHLMGGFTRKMPLHDELVERLGRLPIEVRVQMAKLESSYQDR